MIFLVVLVLLIGLAAAVVVGVAKDPGPSPTDIALGFEHVLDELDFDVVYRLAGPELHDGLSKSDWVAAKRDAYANGTKLGHLVSETVAEEEMRREDAAAVMTRLTLHDGSVVHHEVRLLRRSRKWEVVAYELRPAATPWSAAVRIPGLLLTGGASSRMGTPKAELLVDGERLVQRAARLLEAVCDPVVEVGPGYSTLRCVDEAQPGRGPLAALVAGADAVGGSTPVLLLACDLPFVTERLLARLADWPGTGSVVPVDDEGVVQPVCARYSRDALDRGRALLDDGERSLRALLRGDDVTRLDDIDERDLVDVDTPAEAVRWGIHAPGSLEP